MRGAAGLLPLLLILASPLAFAREPSWLEHLQAWVAAVRQHEPGEKDAALLTIARWPLTQLEEALGDLGALLTYRAERDSRSTFKHKGHPISSIDLREWLGQGEEAANDLLRRGALLHADVAMLAPDVVQQMAPDRRGRTRGPSRLVIDIGDSGPGGVKSGALHWDAARALLDAVRPAPAADPIARQWYRATAAYLQRERQLGEAAPHLHRAVHIFPSDAVLRLLRGAFHEALASPPMQEAAQEVRLPKRFSVNVGSAATELVSAARDLRLALEHDPSLVEARVRLGRVLGLQGHHEEAAAELRRALNAAPAPTLRYYAELFLGEELRQLGRPRDARASFERAAAVCPAAQSPRLALALLARASGGRAAALRAMRDVLAIPPEDEARDDPWWDYHEFQGRDADAWLAELRRPFLSKVSR